MIKRLRPVSILPFRLVDRTDVLHNQPSRFDAWRLFDRQRLDTCNFTATVPTGAAVIVLDLCCRLGDIHLIDLSMKRAAADAEFLRHLARRLCQRFSSVRSRPN